MQTSLTSYDDPRAFLAVAGPWLEPQEVEANLVLGLAIRLRDTPGYSPPPWYLATVSNEERMLGVALRTPPWHVVLHAEAGSEEAVARAVAEHLLALDWPPTGANGRVPVSDRFAEIWQVRTGQVATLTTALRVFRLQSVVWPPVSPGLFRAANADDFGILVEWVRAFREEATPGEPARAAEEVTQRMLEQGSAWLWEDDHVAVSLVATNRRLPHGIVVGPVYTPPDQRGRGYASNAVAALSAALLERGHEYVALFTNLANPTSNHIYQAIGYEPVCDYADYSFGADLEVTKIG